MMFPIPLFPPEWAPEHQYEEIILLKKINTPLRRTGREKQSHCPSYALQPYWWHSCTGLMYESVNAPVHLSFLVSVMSKQTETAMWHQQVSNSLFWVYAGTTERNQDADVIMQLMSNTSTCLSLQRRTWSHADCRSESWCRDSSWYFENSGAKETKIWPTIMSQ